MFLKQSTAVVIQFGPFLDKTDGVTLETGLVTEGHNQQQKRCHVCSPVSQAVERLQSARKLLADRVASAAGFLVCPSRPRGSLVAIFLLNRTAYRLLPRQGSLAARRHPDQPGPAHRHGAPGALTRVAAVCRRAHPERTTYRRRSRTTPPSDHRRPGRQPLVG